MRPNRPRILSLLAALVLAGVISALAALTATGATPTRPASGPTLAHNIAAAKADAVALQATVTLPSGATEVSAGRVVTGERAKPQSYVGTTAGARIESTWTVPGDTPAQVMAYLSANPPAGSTASGTGSSSGPSGPTMLSAIFGLATVPKVIDQRLIVISATPTADGSSVTVLSESVWVVPRTAGSMIPAATHLITVTAITTKGRQLVDATVTSPSRVRAALRYFNGLEADQPFVIACPAELDTGDIVTLDFFSHRGGLLLASAIYQDAFGGTSDECSAVRLVVLGKLRDALLGGDYVSSLNRLFGLKIPR